MSRKTKIVRRIRTCGTIFTKFRILIFLNIAYSALIVKTALMEDLTAVM